MYMCRILHCKWTECVNPLDGHNPVISISHQAVLQVGLRPCYINRGQQESTTDLQLSSHRLCYWYTLSRSYMKCVLSSEQTVVGHFYKQSHWYCGLHTLLHTCTKNVTKCMYMYEDPFERLQTIQIFKWSRLVKMMFFMCFNRGDVYLGISVRKCCVCVSASPSNE